MASITGDSEDESVYRVFPTSVPLSKNRTRLLHTMIIRKVDGPSWTPAPLMKKRNPEWPNFAGSGPENPLGTQVKLI